jgi:hypothetical protein
VVPPSAHNVPARSAYASFPALVLAALAAGGVLAAAPRDARADVTSWLAIGGGGALQLNRQTKSSDTAATITYSVGVGTSPLSAFVLGVLFRGQTFVNLGTDFGAAVRASTGGFARGDWGLAVDAGAAWRPWAFGNYGQWPLQFVLTGGAPWGFQLAVGTEISSVAGMTPARGFFAALEVDLLRLTVMRRGATENWWPNPAPAGGSESPASHPTP